MNLSNALLLILLLSFQVLMELSFALPFDIFVFLHSLSDLHILPYQASKTIRHVDSSDVF